MIVMAFRLYMRFSKESVIAGIGLPVARNGKVPMIHALLLAFVSGIMVFISFDELLPGAEKYGHHHYGIGGVITGMAVMAASLLFFI